MPTFSENHSFARRLLVFCVVWGGVVALFTLQLLIATDYTLSDALSRTLATWSPWIVLTPFVFWLTARFPLTRREGLLKHATIHIVLSVGVALLAHALFETFAGPTDRRSARLEAGPAPRSEAGSAPRDRPPRRRGPDYRPPPPRGPDRRPPPPRGRGSSRTLLSRSVSQLPRTLPTYWALMGIQSMLLFGAQLRKREREAYQLQTKLTQSQLDTLKLQLQPHFLFNALNAISTLVYREPKKADQMIGDLSTLLRGVLDEKNANELPLSRELELLDAYMAIEQMRFGERVQFEKEIESPCLQARVPTLLLQPIVENAVRHGLEPLGKPGTIWLNARKVEDRLHILVEDSGVGRQRECAKGWGIGLSNAEARLETLYGKEGYALTLADREGGGTVVSIEFPFETTHS